MRRAISPCFAIRGFKLPFLALRIRAFQGATKAIAAVEFAIILPIMLIVVLGSVEAARLTTFSRRVNLVASTTVQMLTQTAPTTTGSTTGTVNYNDLHFAQASAMVIFPQVLQDAAQQGISWSSDIKISMASVQIAPTVAGCTTGCTYNVNVVWNAGPNPRPCGLNKLKFVTDDISTPSPTTLPQDLATAGSIIVVDINYTYTPLFTSRFFGKIQMQRSAYVAPRYVQLITYQVISGDDGIGTECPGF